MNHDLIATLEDKVRNENRDLNMVDDAISKMNRYLKNIGKN